MTTTKKPRVSQQTTKNEQESTNFMVRGVRTGVGALESASLGLAELPLSLASGLGAPAGVTDKARAGNRWMLHSVSGSIGTIATRTTQLAGKGVSLVTSVAGGQKP